ncbi:heavy metal-associated isoprenylated plant 2 [Olea europaea subsp. europaea]|uniref:Heavy metal-associated isoprenylated plant 2 n=1 Tax=Olea europaea subsp. europaea TaxID=158383 RepID=A0A8S0U264_OLEEU|nr:heavy metal-associated isoprenylated plant 2 [Olea europaea subsp. europaea]
MSTKKTELKVTISCRKCKTEVLKAVAKLTGVDSVTVDVEKGILTVVGSVDPVCIVKSIRKTGKCAAIISVGPPKKPDPPKEKEKEKEKPVCTLPACCKQCKLVAVRYETYYAPCSIL